MKRIILATLLSSIALQSQATIINFDDLIPPGTYGPSTGNGFVDYGFAFSRNMDAIDVSDWRWSRGVGAGHSGLFAALNNYAGDMVMTQVGGGSFSVQDLWLNGWLGTANSVVIDGLLNNVVTNSVAVSFSTPWQHVDLNFSAVDTLRIGAPSWYFLVDDIQVNGAASRIPEPATLALFGLGLAALGVARQRRGY